jgi:hypothetical protein
MSRNLRVNDEHGHVAMPKLYGAPAYARPPAAPATRAERPFDPDDLPIESERTSEDLELVAQTSERDPAADRAGGTDQRDNTSRSDGRTFRLRLPRLGGSRDQGPGITSLGE